MKSKKKLLKKSRLYIIFDQKISATRPFFKLADTLKKSKADIIQFRDKDSKKEDILKETLFLQRLLADSNKIFIVNDYLDVAKIINCDGVHLGQGDSSVKIARRILGKDKIIGLSCHNLKQALAAQKAGADYIGIGPIFPTPTKPEYKAIGLGLLKIIKRKIKIPFFAIGNINQGNLGMVMRAGAKRIAICRAAF